MHPLSALVSAYNKARLKDIVSKPQFVVDFQGDVALLLNPDVVYECLQTRAKQNRADEDGPLEAACRGFEQRLKKNEC